MLIWKLAIKGIKAHKSYSITLFILILIVSLFSSIALSVLLGGSQLWEEAYHDTNAPAMDFIYLSEHYKDEYLEHFASKPEVEHAEAIVGLMIEAGQCKLDGQDRNNFNSIFEVNETLSGEECIASYGLKYQSSGSLDIGSIVTIRAANGQHEFKVTGFEVDPLYGDAMTAAKRFQISQTAFDKLSEGAASVTELAVYLKADVDILPFVKAFPGASAAFISTNHELANFYALIIPNMVSYFLLGIAGLMVLVGLMVIRHAILATLESDYKTYGILKGLGFSGKQTISFILLQYMLISMMGAVLGIVLSIPFASPVMDVFMSPAGIPAHPVVLPMTMALIALLIGSLAFITAWLNARRVTRISPVQAIAARTVPVHFSSRINPPLKLLGVFPRGLRLAIKQMASRIGQYVLVTIVGCIFTFLLITTLGFRGAVAGRESAGKMFGFSEGHLYFQINDDTKTDDIISFLNKEKKIESIFIQRDGNGELNGNVVFIRGYDDYEKAGIAPALSGRHPKFDNEIAITPQIRDLYHLSIGDTVTLGDGASVSRRYIVTGIISNPLHMGQIILTTFDGVSDYTGRRDVMSVKFEGNVMVHDIKQIMDKAVYQFSPVIFGNAFQEMDDLTQSMRIGITATIGLILGLTIFLTVLITILVSLIAIYRERADMGILRASGYSVKELRRQFSLRFLTASGLGAAIGLFGSYAFSDKMMSLMMGLAGVSSVIIEKTFFVMVPPIVFVVGLTTFSAWYAALHIKKIDMQNLASE